MAKRWLIFSVSAVVLAVAVTGCAHDSHSGPSMQESFSENEIERFVDSYLGIIDVMERYTPMIEEAESHSEVQQLRAQSEQEMARVLEANGLSPEDYSEMAQAMEGDPEFQRQVKSTIDEREQLR
ncbi:DUF4168 domain-containing protein [Halorhodospira sp. 9622]|uniref:DUF4168 domain-containing protein n=1 Tax=Halorhodospira sp. 9622 TaxID=2899136 RepID=UPI001EE92D1E|nr:DUF4168 domain-containing protein [Halorhodospira sp. 9622]MCG5537635.1 DUF4168 domain-containing protein [Halorhodospira sp. 9622]